MSDHGDFDATRQRLWDELVAIHDSWHQYRYLYVESRERVRMLNACARWFFASVQRLLVRDVILGISRLTDPLTVGGFDNLVLRRLVLDPAVSQHDGLAEQLKRLISDVETRAAPIRKHRNKYIAHLDHATAVNPADNVLPGVSVSEISGLIESMEAIYNLHGGRVRQSDSEFALAAMGSVESLALVLEGSERWKKFETITEHLKAQ